MVASASYIVNAVDVPRAAIALSPLARLLPEHRASVELGRRLLPGVRSPPSLAR